MPDAARAATLLAAGAILVLAVGLAGGGILLAVGGRPLVGVLAVVVGLVVAAGGLLFTLSPRVAERYEPVEEDERAENEDG